MLIYLFATVQIPGKGVRWKIYVFPFPDAKYRSFVTSLVLPLVCHYIYLIDLHYRVKCRNTLLHSRYIKEMSSKFAKLNEVMMLQSFSFFLSFFFFSSSFLLIVNCHCYYVSSSDDF